MLENVPSQATNGRATKRSIGSQEITEKTNGQAYKGKADSQIYKYKYMKTTIETIIFSFVKKSHTSLDSIYQEVNKIYGAKQSTIERICRRLAEKKIIKTIYGTARNGREFVIGYKK